jgi:foldase protein PrsA
VKPLTIILALCAVALPAAIAAGCGGVPGSAVATVDGEAIDKEQYDRWLAIATRSGERSNEKALRQQVLQQLISYQWFEAEADERGISLPDSEVQEAFEQQRKASFPDDADYQKFLKSSGQTEEDLLLRVRGELLSNKIREQVTKDTAPLTEQQIADYYKENKASFAEPERRDLRVVVTRTKAAAERVEAALEAGASWNAVAKEHSIDRATRADGGRMPNVASGQQADDFDAAVFDAAEGRLTGPVKTEMGYYVFEVIRTRPPSQRTLAQATPAIKGLLAAERQQKAVDEFLDEFRSKWKERTECGDGYRTKDCNNGTAQ